MRTGTMIVLAACGGLLAACGGAEEEATVNIEENAGVLADNGVLPIDDVTANDMLGNDLGTTDMNAADNAAENAAENTANTY